MALEKQTKSLPFVEGPDTKTDPKLSAKPARIVNSVFRGGTLQKRPGRNSLPSAVAGGSSFAEGDALFAFDSTLVRINNGTGVAYDLAQAADAWTTRAGGAQTATLSKTQLVRNTTTQKQFDQAAANGVVVMAWIEAAGSQIGLHISVYDAVTGAQYQSGVAAIASTTTAKVPRCIALGTSVVVLWADFTNTKLYSAVIASGSPTAAPTATQIRSDVYASGGTFDAIQYSGNLGVVAYQSAAADIKVFFLTSAGAVAASPAITTVTIPGVGAALGRGLLIQVTPFNGNIFVVYADSGTGHLTAYFVLSSALASVLASTDIVTSGNWDGGQAAFSTGASITSASATTITLFLSGREGGTSTIGVAGISHVGVSPAFAAIPTTFGLSITGDVALLGQARVFAAINNDSASVQLGLQPTFWLLSYATPSIAVVARALTTMTGLSEGPNTALRVARPLPIPGGYGFLAGEQGRLAYRSQSGGSTTPINVTPIGISQISATATRANVLPYVLAGATEYIGGAEPRVYDGQALTPCGLPLFPKPIAVVLSGLGSLGLSAGAYQWKFLYSWLNAQGEMTRSPVSTALSATATLNDQATLTVAPMPASMWDILPQGASVVIEVYRSEVNGTVFYRQSSVVAPTLNATGATNISIVDTTSDASLIVGEILYTTGGVLDWEAPPAYSAACAHKNRLIVLPSEDHYSWMPSSEWSPGETVRFSSLTTNRVPSDKGPLTSVASMDGKLVLFAERGAYVVIGDGPDLFGQNNYPPPERIASVDAGPIPGTPIVETPMGLMFQGAQGINLLDRGLNCQFIGSDVQAFTQGPWTVRSAVVDPIEQEVRFLADMGRDLPGALSPTGVTSLGGVSLVYNYFYSQWSVLQNYGGQAATFYQNRYTMVRSDGVCWQEDPSSFRDDAAYVESLIETPWIKLAGLQGYQRLWYATLLGTYGSDFTLIWEVAYNYAGTSPTEPVWTTIETLDGTGVFQIGGPFRVRQHIGHKCEAVKFRIRDSDLSGSGAGMALTDLTLEIGIRKGAFKLPYAQTSRE